MIGQYYDSESIRERNDPMSTNIPFQRHEFRCDQYLGELEFLKSQIQCEELLSKQAVGTSVVLEVNEQLEQEFDGAFTSCSDAAGIAEKLQAAEARIRELEILLVNSL